LIKNIRSKHPNVYAYGLLDVSTQESIELNAESHWGKIEGENRGRKTKKASTHALRRSENCKNVN